MAGAAARALLSALACAAIAACTLGPPPGPASAPNPAPAASSAAPAPGAAQSAEAERERYIAHALAADVRPPGLVGHRHIGAGTGFYIAPDKILTNFHVAGRCAMLTVGNGVEGKEVPAKLIAGDPADDLAVLQTAPIAAEPARFETALYTETGQGLAIVGYPEHGLVVLEAELSPVSAREGDLVAPRKNFPFTGGVRRGNSGSPVLDDSGAVIGVVVAKVDTVRVYQRTGHIVDDIGVAIANRTVFAFLHSNKIDFMPALPGEGLAPGQLLQRAHAFVRQIGCWQ